MRARPDGPASGAGIGSARATRRGRYQKGRSPRGHGAHRAARTPANMPISAVHTPILRPEARPAARRRAVDAPRRPRNPNVIPWTAVAVFHFPIPVRTDHPYASSKSPIAPALNGSQPAWTASGWSGSRARLTGSHRRGGRGGARRAGGRGGGGPSLPAPPPPPPPPPPP